MGYSKVKISVLKCWNLRKFAHVGCYHKNWRFCLGCRDASSSLLFCAVVVEGGLLRRLCAGFLACPGSAAFGRASCPAAVTTPGVGEDAPVYSQRGGEGTQDFLSSLFLFTYSSSTQFSQRCCGMRAAVRHGWWECERLGKQLSWKTDDWTCLPWKAVEEEVTIWKHRV